jgi:haloalkane dehalogenase
VRWLRLGLDALELDRMVVVVQDWGGPIGVLAACDARAHLDAMVVMNTGFGPPKKDLKPTLFHRISHLPVVSEILFRGLGFPQIGLGMAQGDRSSIRGKVSRAYRYPLRDRRTNNAPLALARMVPNHPDHPSIPQLRRSQEELESFAGPVALVWGTRDPILGRLIHRLKRQRPDARVTETEAGHFLQEEVPGEIAEAIRWAVAESA